MEVFFVTSEIAPYSGRGGATEVCAALAKALRGLGHKVTIVSPLYRTIDAAGRSLARRLHRLDVEAAERTWAVDLYDGRTPGGVDLLFLGNEETFGSVERFSEGDADEGLALRTALFSRAVAELLVRRTPQVELIHAHDWPGAAVVMAVKRDTRLAHVRALLTVHDARSQGEFPAAAASTLMIHDALLSDAHVLNDGRINALKAGVLFADQVTTVSPTYAREIQDSPSTQGLHGAFEQIGDAFTGILNGVDVGVWNPATDPLIVARYDAIDHASKMRCKAELQRWLELPIRSDIPLFGAIDAGEASAGLDLLVKSATVVLRNDVQLAVHVNDKSSPAATAFAGLAERWPDRLRIQTGHDPAIQHRIVSGADFLVVAAEDAPSGAVAMQAHRYGTLPVVRATGGLMDCVVDCDPALETGTGFMFDAFETDDLISAIRRAIAAFTHPARFALLRSRVMRIDHSWERSARLYDRLYRDLVAAPEA